MLRSDMMERTNQSSLEDRKIALNRVRMNRASHIFAGTMIDGRMGGKMLAYMKILSSLISHDIRIGCDLFSHYRQ